MDFEMHKIPPDTFLTQLGANQGRYMELQQQHTQAIDDLVRLALHHGVPTEHAENKIVLYSLDGNIDDNRYDDYAHRLLVAFQPVPKRANPDTTPAGALSPNTYQFPKSASKTLRKQAKYGMYITSISLQRYIPMQDMGESASSFHAQRHTQLLHSFSGHEHRYKLDPAGGVHEVVQLLPQFQDVVHNTYHHLIDEVTALLTTDELRASYATAVALDAQNPSGIMDNLVQHTTDARTIHNPGERVKRLVNAIESDENACSPTLARELLVPDIASIAHLGIINASAYYKSARASVSFDQRLQWVKDNTLSFRTAFEGIMPTRNQRFGQLLTLALSPLEQVVQQTQQMALDSQPPRANFLDGKTWQIVRAL